jgi:hypothetical protein
MVDFILTAEFDIDKGSTVKHQYPEPTGVLENFLAEAMLPEGCHARETDWTIFMIRKKKNASAKSDLKPVTEDDEQ